MTRGAGGAAWPTWTFAGIGAIVCAGIGADGAVGRCAMFVGNGAGVGAVKTRALFGSWRFPFGAGDCAVRRESARCGLEKKGPPTPVISKFWIRPTANQLRPHLLSTWATFTKIKNLHLQLAFFATSFETGHLATQNGPNRASVEKFRCLGFLQKIVSRL